MYVDIRWLTRVQFINVTEDIEMRIRELKKSVACSLCQVTRSRILNGLFPLVFIAGCAPQSLSCPMTSQNTAALRRLLSYRRNSNGLPKPV